MKKFFLANFQLIIHPCPEWRVKEARDGDKRLQTDLTDDARDNSFR